MKLNDAITGKNSQTANDMQAGAQFYAKLQRLRLAIEDDVAEHERRLAEKNFQEQQQHAEKLDAALTGYADRRHKRQEELDKKLDKAKKKLSDKEYKEFEAKEKKKFDKKNKRDKEQLENQIQNEEKAQAKQEDKERITKRKEAGKTAFDGSVDIRERISNLRELKQEQGMGAVVDALIGGLGNLVRQLDGTIESIAGYQSKIDTRLMGSGRYWESRYGLWDKNSLANQITGIVAISPLVKQQKVTENLANLVDKGIAYNVEQRAFLQTISEKIATTFNAANSTLLQLIRVQQKDTTAARLGMETTLNQFLNEWFQNTEYLSGLSDNVSASIYEAIAQVGGEQGVGLEYQIQKWLGALYSVGMSQQAVQNIASALGMLGSGNVSGLANNSAMQNLFVMASSKAGESWDYAELLQEGLDASKINKLMEFVVRYLASISNSNKVVQSQYASVFGMSMSDILAVRNLISNQEALAKIVNNDLDYAGAINNLFEAAEGMYQRTSMGELLQTAFDNIKYSMAEGIASNPALYGIWKAANMLTDMVGGIAIPTISVMGNMVDLNTTVADIMRVGALSGGILSSIGNMIAAGSGAGFSSAGMLTALGIRQDQTEADRLSFYNTYNEEQIAALATKTQQRQRMIKLQRGSNTTESGASVSSSSTMVGNTSSSDIYESSMASAEQQKQELSVKDEDTIELKDVNANVVLIYNLFKNIVDPTNGLRTYTSISISSMGDEGNPSKF